MSRIIPTWRGEGVAEPDDSGLQEGDQTSRDDRRRRLLGRDQHVAGEVELQAYLALGLAPRTSCPSGLRKCDPG